MATETSACASTGASFTPSPTIATSAPAALSSRTYARFASGSAPARTLPMPSVVATRAAAVGVSPLSRCTRLPSAESRRTSASASRLSVSPSSNRASHSPLRTSAAMLPVPLARAAGGGAPQLAAEIRADPVAPAVDDALHSRAGAVRHAGGHALRRAPAVGVTHDRPSCRVLGGLFERAGKRDAGVERLPRQGRGRDNAQVPVGQRTRLVEHDVGRARERLDGMASCDDEPAARELAGRDRERNRGRERQRTRAGYRRGRNRHPERARRVELKPGDRGRRRRDEHREHEPVRAAVGELDERLRSAIARSTSRTMPASTVSLPTRSTRTTSGSARLTEPPRTRLPASFVRGSLSPVRTASATAPRPRTTVASAAIVSPGLTSSMSPGRNDAAATRSVDRDPGKLESRSANAGASRARWASAPAARCRA